MSEVRIGGLFEGYGGLTAGVQEVFGGDLAWYSEIDKGALKILTHRFPDVPNVGDITTVDWSSVEPVDILTGGSPCQDLSHAGKRQGMTEGTRSNLWVAMREAIAQLRPRTVVWENVRGALSASAASEVEPCAGCVGDGPGVSLRALGRVLGDLAELGYDAQWHSLRAADVGAPHGRFRVFLVAHPQGDPWWFGDGDGLPIADARRIRGHQALQHDGRRSATGDRAGLPDQPDRDAVRAGPQRGLLPTPRATDGTKGGPNQRGSSGDLMLPSAVALLPTPAVNDMGAGKTVEDWDAWTAKMQAAHGNGNGHGKSLAIEAQRLTESPFPCSCGTRQSCTVDHEAQRLLPTPRAEERMQRNSGDAYNALSLEVTQDRWGDYAAAIAKWEHGLGRPAPAPTMTSAKGNPQLSPVFVEWLMGLPAGWVTDVPGITRNEALKALGNGVVPQQAAAALRHMLAMEVAA